MEHLKIPEGYSSPLTIRETEVAIKEVKDHFERALAKSLHLTRVSAPLFVLPQSGMNDNLNGIERPVSFGIKEQDDACAEIVHSLAKWKRYALKKYGFHSGEGLYTDMTAIRRDEDTDNIHSLYVDQWDWEKIISKKLLPDDSIYVITNNTLFIIECKYQQVGGSVDEKLQTCDFKRKQYQKLMSQVNIDVEYIYLLSDWFKNPKYKDVLDYIISMRCHYYFEYIPLTKLGLPVPPNHEEE